MRDDTCQFCAKPTSTRNVDGPICGICFLAFQRGRALGVMACIEQAKKHGASANAVDALRTLL